MPSNWEGEARPQAVATTGPRTWGITFRGLAAGLTGAVDTAVALFEDPLTAITRRLSGAQDPASSNLADPVTVVTTANLGTSFTPERRGLYAVDISSAVISAAGAVSLNAVLSVDAAAADRVAATAPTLKDGTVAMDVASLAAPAGAGFTIPFKLRGHVIVNGNSTRPIVRLLLTNGAGAVPVAGTVLLAGTTVTFTWLRDRA